MSVEPTAHRAAQSRPEGRAVEGAPKALQRLGAERYQRVRASGGSGGEHAELSVGAAVGGVGTHDVADILDTVCVDHEDSSVACARSTFILYIIICICQCSSEVIQ